VEVNKKREEGASAEREGKGKRERVQAKFSKARSEESERMVK